MQCWLLLLTWECQSSCLFTNPSFIKTALHLCSGLFSCCLSISGPDSKHWLVWRSLCCFVSQPSEKLPPGRPKPVCSKQKLPAAYQWQQFRIQSSDQGDFNSTNYLLNQMDLVWKYPKHLHFPGLSYRDKVSKLQEDSKTNPPRKQRFQSEAQQLFLSFDFHKYQFGVSKKVTKSSNSRVC